MNKTPLRLFFGFIFISLLAYTSYASVQQSLLDWGGLVNRPDNWWTIATLIDAYYGFLTFYVWVLWKEPKWMPRIVWFILIMLLGNMAMAAYVLWQLHKLKDGDTMATLLVARNA
jgi:hypothetical protein